MDVLDHSCSKAAFGGKTIVDDRLWIDIDQLANADPAGSVITTDMESNTVYQGNPAQLKRKRVLRSLSWK